MDPLAGIRALDVCNGGICFERWRISGAGAISTLNLSSSQAPVNKPSIPQKDFPFSLSRPESVVCSQRCQADTVYNSFIKRGLGGVISLSYPEYLECNH